MENKSLLVRNIVICLVAASIPALLAIDGIQARRFAAVENEIELLEQKQVQLVENNKNLITSISVLSSADRIERIAYENLNMRPAESSEIIRVEMKSNGGVRQ